MATARVATSSPHFVATVFGAGLGILAKVFANRKRD